MDLAKLTKKDKLEAAYKLLLEPTTTLDKISEVATLLKGLHPKFDRAILACQKNIKRVKNLEKGDVIMLTANELPEDTGKQKKRKKALILFISSWRNLQSEVKRIDALYKEYEASGGKNSPLDNQFGFLSKVLGAAKGPLGVITIVALGAVVGLDYLKTNAVNVTVKNIDCPALNLNVKLPVEIPGIELPKEPIQVGKQELLTLPPLNVDIDATKPGALKISLLGLNEMIFELNNIKSLIFNNQELIGAKTDLNLGAKKENDLNIGCS